MNVAHFYHAYVAGDWTEPVLEHVDALLAADFTGPVYLGLVGADLWRGAARDAFHPLDVRVAAEADEGFEQVTLAAVREYAQTHDGAVLYAHTKGASNEGDIGSNALWRRAMSRRVVADWRANLKALEDCDAVGCHWLTQENTPDNVMIVSPFFAGNFWMARCDYLRTLPECGTASRWDAEHWIGLGNPRVLDLLPGWPSESLWQ